MLVLGEADRPHQAGVEIGNAFERGNDRRRIGLAAGALDRLDVAYMVSMSGDRSTTRVTYWSPRSR
jgi:hypothetical protein